MTDPTDLTPAEQAAAEYLWSQFGGEDYDPENGGHARAVADHADMARDIARDHVDLAGRIYDGIIGMHDLSTVRRYADRYGVEAPHGLPAAMRAVVAERHIIVHWDVCFESVPTPEALEALFDEDRIMLNPAGTRGVAYWLGPGDAENHSRPLEEKVLRVDLDPATGAGAARWQGGLVAVEPGYTATPFGVWGENEFEAVPIGVARVSYATARRIAVEYVKHGSRPEWISWTIDTWPY
jgi:hypothetical protein